MKISYLYCILILLWGCNNASKKNQDHEQSKTNDTAAIVIDDIKGEIANMPHAVAFSSEIENTSSEENTTTNDTIPDVANPTEEKEAIEKSHKETAKAVKKKKIAKANHQAWNALLQKYVSATGKVNYEGFKSEIKVLDAYLAHLNKTPPVKGWKRSEMLCYWFNIYNAATVQLISKAYPVNSIRDINTGKPWDKKFVKSNNKTWTLNQIENEIVRPYTKEPRLHVAFNCAAVSCPKMLNEAFLPKKLYSQLSKLSKIWLTDTSKNKISKNKIEISKIFEWYKDDFYKGIIPFINKYSGTQVDPDAQISYLEYDWKLNN